jgi:hypothetical protein
MAWRLGMSNGCVRDMNLGWFFGLGENGAATAGPSGPKDGLVVRLCG